MPILLSSHEINEDTHKIDLPDGASLACGGIMASLRRSLTLVFLSFFSILITIDISVQSLYICHRLRHEKWTTRTRLNPAFPHSRP